MAEKESHMIHREPERRKGGPEQRGPGAYAEREPQSTSRLRGSPCKNTPGTFVPLIAFQVPSCLNAPMRMPR